MSGKKAREKRQGHIDQGELLQQTNLFTKTTNQCIFCGVPGNLSKQHVWPKWMENVIPIRFNKYTHTTTGGDQPIINRNTQHKEYNGHQGTQKIRKLCVSCNGGWVNVIESKMRNVFTDLALNNKIILNKTDQINLATWAVLSTIIYEYADEETRTTSDEDRKFMYKQKLPPSGWQVWIAKKDSSNTIDQQIFHQALTIKEGYFYPPSGNAQSTTFTARDLIIFTTKTSSDFNNFLIKRTQKNKVKQIFPIVYETIDWGSVETINKDEIDELKVDFQMYLESDFSK